MRLKVRLGLSALRIALGIVFIAASVTKLPAQSLFLNEVLGYNLLPDALAMVYAVSLPWVELLTGAALIFGVFTTAGLLLSILMATSFAIANAYALHGGSLDSCGSCFGQLIPMSLGMALAIDLLMIAAALLLFLTEKGRALSIGDHLARRFAGGPGSGRKIVVRKTGAAIFLLVTVLAVGIPLSLAGRTSRVLEDIDKHLESGKPVLLYFYLDGCDDCARQQPVIDDLEETYQDSVGFVRANYRVEGRLAGLLDVTFVPTTLLLIGKTDSDYTVLKRFDHYTNKLSLQRGMYEAPAAHPICERYGPLADFSAMPTAGFVPALVRFADSSLGNTEWHWEYEWAWDFDNDGVADSRVRNPEFVYDMPGKYSVSLTLTGPCGVSTIFKPDYLLFVLNDNPGEGCKVDFSAEPTSVDTFTPVIFSGLSEADIVSWKWDFDGDGTVDSTTRDPVHSYASPGAYSVTLTVEGAGCENRVIKQDYISVTACLCG
jgi:PKD repeat protein/uncharacterized membrane protein YphA (DoxX/SURF4 family)